METAGRRILGCLMALLLAMGLSIAPITVEDAHAATKSYMKSSKVKWDLKKNKAVSCNDKIQQLGTKKVKITVKSMKTITLKNGKKRTTFTLVGQRSKSDFNPTPAQVDKMSVPFAYGASYALVDYATGMCLENNSKIAKKRRVSVKVTSNWKYSSQVTRYGSNGRWIRLPMKWTVKLSVTYPKSYTGLCLGVWLSDTTSSSANDSFWAGKKALRATRYYKKFKSNMHWMRIR